MWVGCGGGRTAQRLSATIRVLRAEHLKDSHKTVLGSPLAVAGLLLRARQTAGGMQDEWKTCPVRHRLSPSVFVRLQIKFDRYTRRPSLSDVSCAFTITTPSADVAWAGTSRNGPNYYYYYYSFINAAAPKKKVTLTTQLT